MNAMRCEQAWANVASSSTEAGKTGSAMSCASVSSEAMNLLFSISCTDGSGPSLLALKDNSHRPIGIGRSPRPASMTEESLMPLQVTYESLLAFGARGGGAGGQPQCGGERDDAAPGELGKSETEHGNSRKENEG